MSIEDLREEVERWREAAEALPARPAWADHAEEYVGTARRSPLRDELDALVPHLEQKIIELRDRGTLIVGVGGTPQATLLSIAAHRPARLVLVVQLGEQGEGFLRELRRGLSALPTDLRVAAEPLIEGYDPKNPVHLFLALSALLHEPARLPRPVSIDITSGTKAMASIAFQLAVEAEEEEVFSVYLQGKYLRELGVPEPGSALLKRLPDPGLALALHDRRRVEALWDSAEFGAAAELLAEVVARLDRVAWDEGELTGRWRRLLQLARGLHAWSEARYDEVEPCLQAAGEPLPAFVAPLCRGWAGLGVTLKEREEALKDDGPLALRQLVDAWGWLARQRGRDPRLRLLRWFSLGESAMEVLVRALAADGAGRFGIVPTSGDQRALEPVAELEDRLLKAKYRNLALLLGVDGGLEIGKKDNRKLLHARDIWLTEAAPWTHDEDDSWRDVRNACVHFVGEVPAGLLDQYRDQSLALILACAEHLPGVVGLRAELEAWAAGQGWDPGTVADRLRA